MTTAADRFTDSALTAWDHRDCWTATAEKGYLAEPDADALRTLCEETGDDFDTAEAEVLEFVRAKAAR